MYFIWIAKLANAFQLHANNVNLVFYGKTLLSFFIVDSDGESTCDEDVSSCDYSGGAQVVEELAASNNQFVEEFLSVFTKMIEKVWVILNEEEGIWDSFDKTCLQVFDYLSYRVPSHP